MSIQLDRALEKVRLGVSSSALPLPPGDYMVYGGAIRSFLEGRAPMDYDIMLIGSGTPEPTSAALLFGAPRADIIRSISSRQSARESGWGYMGTLRDGREGLLFRQPTPYTYSGGIPVTVIGLFTTDYAGNTLYPESVIGLLDYSDFRVSRAAIPFSVSPEGHCTFDTAFIPPGFEEAVATRTLYWDTDSAYFPREKIERITRYLRDYGYHIPDPETLRRMQRYLNPSQDVVDLWLLYNPHLR